MQVVSIFYSMDGEVNGINGWGKPAVFIRFAGCNLNCWKGNCDTLYAKSKRAGKKMTVDEIIEEVGKFNCYRVTISGGEPLWRNKKELEDILLRLQSGCFLVNVETNGSIPISSFIRHHANITVDCKCPSTGEHKKMILDYGELRESDWVKFVISDWNDYQYAKRIKKQYIDGQSRANVAFSPRWEVMEPRKLVEWIKRDGLDVTLNLQLHKWIWPEAVGTTTEV